jgi:hypothetical protein
VTQVFRNSQEIDSFSELNLADFVGVKIKKSNFLVSVLLHVCQHRFCDLSSGVWGGGRGGAGCAVRKLNSEHFYFGDLQIVFCLW